MASKRVWRKSRSRRLTGYRVTFCPIHVGLVREWPEGWQFTLRRQRWGSWVAGGYRSRAEAQMMCEREHDIRCKEAPDGQ